MIDPIEELLQIHIDHHPVAVLYVSLCHQHRVARSTPRPEAVAVFGEGRINDGLQNLQQGLLDQPIRDRWNPQFTHPAIRLRNLDSPHRPWPIAAVQ